MLVPCTPASRGLRLLIACCRICTDSEGRKYAEQVQCARVYHINVVLRIRTSTQGKVSNKAYKEQSMQIQRYALTTSCSWTRCLSAHRFRHIIKPICQGQSGTTFSVYLWSCTGQGSLDIIWHGSIFQLAASLTVLCSVHLPSVLSISCLSQLYCQTAAPLSSLTKNVVLWHNKGPGSSWIRTASRGWKQQMTQCT